MKIKFTGIEYLVVGGRLQNIHGQPVDIKDSNRLIDVDFQKNDFMNIPDDLGEEEE